jgi:hypothetical protein
LRLRDPWYYAGCIEPQVSRSPRAEGASDAQAGSEHMAITLSNKDLSEAILPGEGSALMLKRAVLGARVLPRR